VVGWEKKTGTLGDIEEILAQIAATGDRSVQDRYLPALDEALSNLPKSERRKADPIVVQGLWAAEAKYGHSVNGEDVDLISTKLGAMISSTLREKDPVKALSGYNEASGVTHMLRSIGNVYLKVYQEE
jgi:hypothetical protein